MNIQTHYQKFEQMGVVLESKKIDIKYSVIVADFIDFCIAYSSQLNENELKICWELIQKIISSQQWNRKLQAGSVITQLLNDNMIFKKLYSKQICEQGYQLLFNEKREVRNIAGQMICCCNTEDILSIINKIKENIEQQNNIFREAVATMCYNVFICDTSVIEQVIKLCQQIVQFNPLTKDQSLENNYVFWYINRSITKILTINKYNFSNEELETIYQIIEQGFISNELKVRKSVGEALGCYYCHNQNTYNQMIEQIKNYINIFEKQDKNVINELNFKTQTILLSFTFAIQILTGTHNWIKISVTQIKQDHAKLLQQLYNILPIQLSAKALNGSYQQSLIKALIPNQQQLKQLLQTQYLMSLEGALDATVYMQKYWHQSINELKYELLLCQNYPVQVIAQLAMRINHFDEYNVNDKCDLLSFNWTDIQPDILLQFIEQQLQSTNKDIAIAAFNLLNNYIKDNSDKIESINQQIFNEIQNHIEEYKEVQILLSTLMQLNKLTQEQQDQIQDQVNEIFMYLDDNSAYLIPYVIAQKNTDLIQYIIIGAFDISGNLFSQISRQWLNIAVKYIDFDKLMSAFQELQEINIFLFNGTSAMIYYLDNVANIEIDSQLYDFKDYMYENIDQLDFDDQTKNYFEQFNNYYNKGTNNYEIIKQTLNSHFTDEQQQIINDCQNADINVLKSLLKTSMELNPLCQIVLYGSLITCQQNVVLSDKMDIKYNNFVDFNENF